MVVLFLALYILRSFESLDVVKNQDVFKMVLVNGRHVPMDAHRLKSRGKMWTLVFPAVEYECARRLVAWTAIL